MSTTWPLLTLPPLDVDWHLGQNTSPGDTSMSGENRLGFTNGGGLWTCTMSGIWVHSTSQMLAARAIESAMKGGARPVIVPALEVVLAPWPGAIPADPFTAGTIVVELADAAALRATTLNLTVTTAGPIVAGHRFAIYHTTVGWRLYGIETAGTLTAGEQEVTIDPPLREACDAGTDADFQNPRCNMRLMNADSFFGPIHQQKFAELTAVFQECSDVA